MNEWIMEVWLEKSCLRSSPGSCNNCHTWDMHTYPFVTQIGAFKMRVWACSYLNGSFAGHWTWEITNKYWWINELGSFSQNNPNTNIAKLKHYRQNNPSALGHQKHFSHEKVYIVTHCVQSGHCWASMTTYNPSHIHEGEKRLRAEITTQ